MSVYEANINNPKKQLEFYRDLSEQLEQENARLKDKIGKLKFAIESNCIKDGKKNQEICCDGDYLLEILKEN